MIPVYSHRGCILLEIPKDDLTDSKAEETIDLLVNEGLKTTAGVLLLDSDYQPIESGSQNLEKLKLGVILPEGVTKLPLNPIKFYLKRADKRGAVLTGHPFTSIAELSSLASKALGIVELNQEIYFNGRLLSDPTQTLLELGIDDNKVVHILDRALLESDPTHAFSIELQDSKFPSESKMVEVTGATTLEEFKRKAAAAIEIPVEYVVVAYLSQILEDEKKTLADLKFLAGALVKILDDRNAIIERVVRTEVETLEKHKGIHRATSRDSIRQVPRFEIRRT